MKLSDHVSANVGWCGQDPQERSARAFRLIRLALSALVGGSPARGPAAQRALLDLWSPGRALGGLSPQQIQPLSRWARWQWTLRLRPSKAGTSHKVFSSRRKRLMSRHSCDHDLRRPIASTSALHVHGGRRPRASCSGDTLYCTPCSHVAVSLQLLMAVESA